MHAPIFYNMVLGGSQDEVAAPTSRRVHLSSSDQLLPADKGNLESAGADRCPPFAETNAYLAEQSRERADRLAGNTPGGGESSARPLI